MDPSSRRGALPVVSPDGLTPASALCTSCGLCCDGTVFRVARLREGEVPSPEMADGARWEDGGERPAFLLPCHAFVGHCGIYEVRPEVCGSFRCRVLRRAEQGSMSWERAHALVREGKARRDALRGALVRVTGEGRPGESLASEMRRVRGMRGDDESEGSFRRRMGEVLVAGAALRHLLSEHFLLPKGKDDASGEGVEEGAPSPTSDPPAPAARDQEGLVS